MSKMSANLPTISITTEKPTLSEISDDDSNSNDMNYEQSPGAITDVEDFDSQVDIEKSRSPVNVNLLLQKNNIENDGTDIEDYNDSGTDDEEKSNVYPELKISLQEFLQQGLQQQQFVDNEAKEKIELKAGNFLQAQNLNGLPDYLTDCEDYNTDSEIDGNCEKSVCVDLEFVANDQGRVCIIDEARPIISTDNSDGNLDNDDDDDDDVSALSDVSDLATALSDAMGTTNAAYMHDASEDEFLHMSADEEECQIVYSGSDTDNDENNACLPSVDVRFVRANAKQQSIGAVANKNIFLNLAATNDEVLTDIEKLDDSAAENDSFDNDEEHEQPIPRAIILAPGDDGACQTDVEDMLCDDSLPTSAGDGELQTVTPDILPPSQREVVMLKEDQNGDTTMNVMPMDNEFQFGIYNNFKDEGQTDSEDISCTEDYVRKQSIAVDILTANAEGELTVFNELLKPTVSKRVEMHSNTESVTDVEEIYVAGTNRRKKLKTRSSSKGKSKFLDISNSNNNEKEDGTTDVEDMELSENGLPPGVRRNAVEKQSKQNADKVTDIEDLTADEASDVSDTEAPPINADTSNLKQYQENCANIVVTLETVAGKTATKQCKLNVNALNMHMQKDDNLSQLTDTEDIQVPSDAEECAIVENVANRACNEFTDMLNESYTVVHEKTGSSFNVDREKLHIKGMNELSDAHTDVEYVESDEPTAKEDN